MILVIVLPTPLSPTSIFIVSLKSPPPGFPLEHLPWGMLERLVLKLKLHLQPPDVKNRLIGKDSDAGRD